MLLTLAKHLNAKWIGYVHAKHPLVVMPYKTLIPLSMSSYLVKIYLKYNCSYDYSLRKCSFLNKVVIERDSRFSRL